MKKIIIAALILLSVGLNAQNSEEPTVAKDSSWSQSFSDNLYIEFDGGTQVLSSEDVDNLETMDRFTPFLSFSMGKWFSPVWGIEFKVDGNSLNGFSTTEGTYTAVTSSQYNEDPVRKEAYINPDGSYNHYVKYANFSANVFLSFVNIFGYREEAKFDCIAVLGIGDMHVFEYKGIPENNTMSLNYGIIGKYKFAPKWDLNLKVSSAMFDNDFEGRIAGDNKNDMYVAGSLGIVYYFKKRGFERTLKGKN